MNPNNTNKILYSIVFTDWYTEKFRGSKWCEFYEEENHKALALGFAKVNCPDDCEFIIRESN